MSPTNNKDISEKLIERALIPIVLIVISVTIPAWLGLQLASLIYHQSILSLGPTPVLLAHLADPSYVISRPERELTPPYYLIWICQGVLYSLGAFGGYKWGWPSLKGKLSMKGNSQLSYSYVAKVNSQLGCNIVKNTPPGVILGDAQFCTYDKSIFVTGLPGSGKSAWIVRNILHAPGPTMVTSTKRELFGLTAGYLYLSGRPVYVFDCGGTIPNLGNFALRWSPLYGCEDVAYARKMAGRFAYGAGFSGSTTNGDFWTGKTTNVLQWLFVASAIGGHYLSDVLAWLADTQEMERQIALLRKAGFAQGAKELANTFTPSSLAAGPSSSIVAGVEAALAGFASRALIDACSPSRLEAFSVEDWIARRGVIYLIGTIEDQKSVAGVIAAFIEDTLERARQIAQPVRPPIRLILDEAPNIARLRTLPEIVTTGRGDGIGADIIGQDLHKFQEGYGPSAAASLRLSCAGEIAFGGSRDGQHLRELSGLTGEVSLAATSISVAPGARTKTTSERIEQKLKPEDLRRLRANHALLVYANEPHRVVHLAPYWQVRSDYEAVVLSRLWCEKQFFALSGFTPPKKMIEKAAKQLSQLEANRPGVDTPINNTPPPANKTTRPVESPSPAQQAPTVVESAQDNAVRTLATRCDISMGKAQEIIENERRKRAAIARKNQGQFNFQEIIENERQEV